MKNIVLKKYDSINYALIARVREDESVKEFVAAWCYDEETKSWGQGHYFMDIDNAVNYIQEKVVEHYYCHKEYVCLNCKYYSACGDIDRTAPCVGKEVL